MIGTINCNEASRLVSETRDRELPLRQRMQLRFHLTLCKMCNVYSRQIDMLGEVSRRANMFVLQASLPLALSANAKERIKQKLSESG